MQFDESGGTCIAVADADLIDWMHRATAAEGISICPETAATVAAAAVLRQRGWIEPKQKVVINCAAGQKYPHLSNPELQVITNVSQVNYETL